MANGSTRSNLKSMERDAAKNITVPQFTCDDDFVVFNRSLAAWNCFVVQQDDACSEACSSLDARLPNYSEFMALNATRVKRKCKSGFCNLEIEANFNFATHLWESNNHELNNLTWRSHEYPLIDDLLVICNLLPTLQRKSSAWSYVQPTPYFCTKSTPQMDINRTDYFNWEFTYFDLKPLEALFLCKTDPFDYKSLKMGTFDQAMEKCGSLMTPDLCDDPLAVETLVQLLTDAHRLRKFAARFMWTGTKRFNETHFRGEEWISIGQLKKCVWKPRRKWTNSIKL